MLQFGICTPEQYAKASEARRLSGSGLSFDLLEVSDPPTPQDIQRFEEISLRVQTSNGTTRTTFRNRMADVDELSLKIMRRCYNLEQRLSIQDRAASHCLTSVEWARQVMAAFPRAEFEASDGLIYLYRVSLERGGTYFVEPTGLPLQYVRPPFVVCLNPREPYRYLLNHFVATLAYRSFRRLCLTYDFSKPNRNGQYRRDKLSLIHPEAHSLSRRDPRFTVCERSVFARTPSVDVLRTMNILNLAYFSTDQILDGVGAAFESLKPGGLWIVGRTLQETFKNHATFFRRNDANWEILGRIGDGSEIEPLVMSQRDVLAIRR